jgi:hypothetical protein
MSDETKFTPGPWRFKIGDSFSATDYIIEQDTPEEEWVVLRWEIGPYRNPNSEQANARLIAAAPELLDAAQFALTVLRSHFQFDSHDFDEVRETLQAAITKAIDRKVHA